ncbi:LacI family DNA-binding transcriptional regulator [Microbacterium trichothecenolyticum]|uniref:LacI family transcriptional regulator n=1 Tax=Microbacterium trichothecenolyticum TaxID=69370 RepID=A0ABU0TY53_MICTR|nr:LacI family DNA-binding transcriptional regulator [Microbacterium trichothecenolyticum]MDQ1124585.1 LacI family transcriptional regulator [Microbacterium trichothecenolyticum]
MVDIASDERRVVTLKDVASASGVSISTVSRVLDDRTPRSRSATAQRVRAIADELGYRRNVSASSLRRGATATIGVLVPRLTDAVMALMFEAVERAAHRQGYFAVVATCGDDADDETRATETLLDRRVDGLVLATARLDDALPASLRDRGIPHVLALRTDGVSPSSLGDDETGGYLAVRHLLDLGHTDIGIVTGPRFTSSGRDRRAGAERALREAGIALPDGRVLAAGYGIDHGIEAAGRLLDGDGGPTAVFAANDNLAMGVASVAHARGRQIGRDLSIVGYNDIPLVSRLPVPFTSVRTHFDRIAEVALDLLLDTGTAARIERTMPTLIPRSSTAPLGR